MGGMDARLWAGVVVSVLLHALAAVLLAGLPEAPTQGVPMRTDDGIDTLADRMVSPGDATQRHATINWIGYEAPQEQQAPESTVEQAALTPDPGAPPANTAPVSQPTPEAPEQPTEEQTPDEPAEEAIDPREPAEPPSSPAPSEQPETGLPPVLPDAGEPIMAPGTPTDRTDPAPPPAGPMGPPTEAANPDAPAATPTPSPTTPAPPTPERRPGPISEPSPTDGAGQGGTSAGASSDRESNATSTRKTHKIQPGGVKSAEGLEIKTKYPRFSALTRVTASPRNAIVELQFDRRGRVGRATLVQSTGNRGVDDPILDAMYRWTASGEALDELPASDPKATISMRFEIVLR